jgi:hypothetical protein
LKIKNWEIERRGDTNLARIAAFFTAIYDFRADAIDLAIFRVIDTVPHMSAIVPAASLSITHAAPRVAPEPSFLFHSSVLSLFSISPH